MYHFVLKDVSRLIVIMQLKDESRNKSTYNIIENGTVFEPRLKSLKKGYIYSSIKSSRILLSKLQENRTGLSSNVIMILLFLRKGLTRTYRFERNRKFLARNHGAKISLRQYSERRSHPQEVTLL